MQKQIFPIIADEGELPFYIVGVGVEQWQFPLDRPEGYEFPQILVSANGEGEISIGGKTEKLAEGAVIYIPPHCPHSYHAAVKDWYLDWICFSGSEAIPLLEKWGLNRYQSINGGSERIRQAIAKAYYTIIGDRLYGNHYASAILYDILIEYRRLAGNRLSARESGSSASMAEVLKFIEENYSSPVKLPTLAEIAGVTEQHLCRLFKKNLGMRPMEYLAKLRIRHAKELLVYSEKSIAEIAEETGFVDNSYFTVVFKKYEGMTPGEYRGSQN